MRLITHRFEILGTLAWMAACTVIALQYTSMRGAIAAGAGALLGGIAARWTARRGAHLEAGITLCPFVCAVLLLGCDGLHRSQFSGTVGPFPIYQLAEILILGGTAFCVSLALELLRAEFPQAAALRFVLSFASFARLLVLHRHGLEQQTFLLASVAIAIGAVVFGIARPSFHWITSLLGLIPQRPLNPSPNA